MYSLAIGLVVMSVVTDIEDGDALQLGQLNGAVLTYKNADGEQVVVEFDE